jgi:Beta-fructosidases (levanase/invertase)
VPGLFRLGAKDVLIYSPTKESKYTRYFLGSYTNRQFAPELQGKMDFGGYFYAATTFPANGRRIMIAWIKEGRSIEDVLKAGWSGMLSVPRELSLTAGGRLQLEPAAEVNALRGRKKHYAHLQLASGKTMPVAAQGDTLDIVAEFDPGDASRFGLKVRQSPGGEEETLVYFDRKESRFVMDTTHSSQSSGVDRKILADAFDFAPGKPLRLRILVDRSVIEAFAEKRAAVSGRIYPSLPSSLGVQPFAEGGAATLRSLDIWEMKGSQ